MSYDHITSALRKKLKALSDTNSVDVAWVGKKFDPPDDQPYYKYAFKFADPEGLAFGLGITERIYGIFQVNIFSPESKREGKIIKLVDELKTHFWPDGGGGQWLTEENIRVRIFKPPHVGGNIGTAGWLEIPVKVFFFANIP